MVLAAAGLYYSAALNNEEGLWVWACKEDLSWARSVPHRVEGIPPLLKVACGNNSLMLEDEEGLWVLGDNK